MTRINRKSRQNISNNMKEKNNMKSKSFNYDDYLQLQANYSELDDAHYALFMEYSEVKVERDVARRDCAVAERNHMNTLERFLEAQERIDNLLAELSEYKCNTKVGCKLIDKDALVKQFDGNIEYFTADETIEMIDNVPTIDAVEVVRCANCVRWNPDARCGYGYDLDGTKRRYGICDITKLPIKENGYCYYGSDREVIKDGHS